MWYRRLVAPVALSALLLASCGASGGSEAGGDTSTTAAVSTTAEPSGENTSTSGSPETTGSTEAPATTETTESSTTSTPSGGGEICEKLQAISDYDGESSEVVGSGDWPAIQQFLIDNTEGVLEAYDDAIAVADAELAEALSTLRDYTADVPELAEEATSLTDLSGKLTAHPDVMAAGTAGLTLNTFAEDTCGFSTGGN